MIQFKSPKSRSGRRTWALPAPVVEVLRCQPGLQERWRVEEGPAWTGYTDPDGVERDLVFTTRTGGLLITPARDRAAWGRLLAAHGLPALRVHDARHTAATVLLELGVGPRVVMDLMGWSSMQMVARYQHVLDEMKEVVAGQVADALFGQGPAQTPPVPGPPAGVVDFQAFRARRTG